MRSALRDIIGPCLIIISFNGSGTHDPIPYYLWGHAMKVRTNVRVPEQWKLSLDDCRRWCVLDCLGP